MRAKARRVETLIGEGLRRLTGDAERRDLERALANARQRGQAIIAAILASPEMLTAEAFAARAHTTLDAVHRWRTAGRVLALEGSSGDIRYPAWQLDEYGVPLTELPRLLQAVPSSWIAYRSLVSEWPELGGKTGLELLKSSRADLLIDVTDHFGETF
jgi:hypothetical protein